MGKPCRKTMEILNSSMQGIGVCGNQGKKHMDERED
jgi:hypothetical protein